MQCCPRCLRVTTTRSLSQSPKNDFILLAALDHFIFYIENEENGLTSNLVVRVFCSFRARQTGKKKKKRNTKIYYNHISLWSELKEDVKMESRLNVACIILSRGIWTFGTLSVGRDCPPCCSSACSSSEPQWAEHGTSHAAVMGLNSHRGPSN